MSASGAEEFSRAKRSRRARSLPEEPLDTEWRHAKLKLAGPLPQDPQAAERVNPSARPCLHSVVLYLAGRRHRLMGIAVLALVAAIVISANLARYAPWAPGRLHFGLMSGTEGVFDAQNREVYRWDGHDLRDAAGRQYPTQTGPGALVYAVVELPSGDYTLVANGSPGCAAGLSFHITAGRDFDEPFLPISQSWAGGTAARSAPRCYPSP